MALKDSAAATLLTALSLLPLPATAPLPSTDPVPAADPLALRAPGDCLPAFGELPRGTWPAACWRPYADTSPFNTPLDPAPPLDPRSAQIVARLNSLGGPDDLVAGDAGTPRDFFPPTYYSLPGDPVVTLHCTQPWGRCAVEGMRIAIPAAARAAAGGDHHMTIVDQATGWEYDLWRVHGAPGRGGALSLAWGGRTRLDGDGLGSDAVAARFGSLAGVIRAQELEAGQIRHALAMVVYCDNGTYVYPATKSGRSCSSIGLPNTGAPAMGQLFKLELSDEQIAALPVPGWKRTILTAMAHYGMYVTDTGTGSWGLRAESGSTYTSFGFQDELARFAQAAGVPSSGGEYAFGLRDVVDWSRLQVVRPPATFKLPQG